MAPWCLHREERKKKKEKEKGEIKMERKKNPTRLLLILILRRHTDHAHYTDGDCVELQNT